MSDPTALLATELIELILDFCENTTVVCAAQICRRWRSCARPHPLYFFELDFHMHINGNPPNQEAYEKVFSDLRKATCAAVPVWLTLVLTDDLENDVRAMQANEPYYADIWTELGQYLKAVLPLAMHFELYSESTAFIEILLNACNQAAPILESFAITHSGFMDPNPVMTSFIFGGSAPRLRDVRLSEIDLPPDHLPIAAFSAVTEINLASTVAGHRDLRTQTPKLQVLRLRPNGGLSPNIRLPMALHTLFISLPSVLRNPGFPQYASLPLDSILHRISSSEMRAIGVPILPFAPDFDPMPYLRGLPNDLHLHATRTCRKFLLVQEDTLKFLGDKESEDKYRTPIVREFYSRRSGDVLRPYINLLDRLTAIGIQPAFLQPLLRLALEFPSVRRMSIDVQMLSRVFPRRKDDTSSFAQELDEDACLFEQKVPTELLRPDYADQGIMVRFPVLEKLRLWASPPGKSFGYFEAEPQVKFVWRARVMDIVEEMGVDMSVLVLDGLQLADRVDGVTYSVPDVLGRDWAR